jgi:hypothetical protein
MLTTELPRLQSDNAFATTNAALATTNAAFMVTSEVPCPEEDSRSSNQ